MAVEDLPIAVLQKIGAVSVQHAGSSGAHRSAMLDPVEPAASGLDAEDRDVAVVEERMEQADRVRPAADGGDDRIGQAALLFHYLLARLLPITDWNSRTSSG